MMIGGLSGDIGYDFEPVITLHEIVHMIQRGKTPLEVRFNPPLLGDPDGWIKYQGNEIHFIQAKTKKAGSGNWTPNKPDIIKAIADFTYVHMKALEQADIGINTSMRFFLCLEGEPNSALRDFAEAIKEPLDATNLGIILEIVSKWLESKHWKDQYDDEDNLLPRPTDEQVISSLNNTRVCYRFDKPKLESNLRQFLGSHYDSFILEAKTKTVKEPTLRDIVNYLRTDERVEAAIHRVEESHIPLRVRNVLVNLLSINEILDFTNGPWNLNGRDVNICGTIHTQRMLFGVHYTEEVIMGDDSPSYAMDAVVPGTREIILITSSSHTRQGRGIHIVNPDSDTLDEDLRKCVVS